MELTVQNVYGLLLRSKLLSPDEAKTMYARWTGGGQGRRREPEPASPRGWWRTST